MLILSIIFTIIIVNILIYFVFFLIKYNKIRKNNNELKMQLSILQSKISYDFDADSKFLRYLISYKCSIYINITLENQIKMQKMKLVNDEEFNKAINKLSKDIILNLTPEYKQLMLKYFSEENLNIYIIEMILDIISKYSKENNKFKLDKMYNRTAEIINQNTGITRNDIDSNN